MKEIRIRYKVKNHDKLIYETDESFAYMTTHGVIARADGGMYFVEERQLYTGFKDANGKRIWEGDILQRIDFLTGYLVYWEQKYGRWSIGNSGNNLNESLLELGFIVIGNIYENPHLIKEFNIEVQ